MQNSEVVKFKLYDMKGITAFSTEPAQIGEDKSLNAGFASALSGKIVNELTHRDQFSVFERSTYDADLVSSYIPIFENGNVVAVFELYQDVTLLMQRIDRSLWQIGTVLVAGFGALYLMLLLVVRHAQKALSIQEARLVVANRELDQRVAERTHALQKSEAMFRASEARFRALTEMSSDFYWESDIQHRFTQCTENKRTTAYEDFHQASCIGQFPWEVDRTSNETSCLAHSALLDAHLPFREFVISCFGADGDTRYVSVSGEPIFNFSGKFAGYRGVGSDISERRKKEEQTRQLLTENETIMNNTLVGVVYLKHRRIVSCNRRLEEIFQYSLDELIGKSTERFYITREIFEHVGEVAYATVAENRSYHTQLRLRHKDGSIFWGEINGRAVDPASPQEGSIWIYSDITELKLAEADLRIAATSFESQTCIFVTDAQGAILRINKAFTINTGFTGEDVLGQTPKLFSSGRHNAAFYREMWETLINTGRWQGEIWNRHKNGEVHPKFLTISAVKSEDGSITNYVGEHTDITERMVAEDQIRALAYFDQLTGLPNRTLLLDRLKQTMTTSNRSRTFGAMLFIDLDHFKTINDTLGHDMGDLLLKEVAKRLTICVREGDTVARFGGDEFMVILENLGMDEREVATQTEIVGKKILTILNQKYQLGDMSHHSTASIGCTLFCGYGTSIDDLMKHSDLAMYKAKSTGRNTLCFFDPAMQILVMERMALEEDLRLALFEKRFLLHYQAQVSGERLMGAEVLVRCQHPQRGLVSPAEFIPLAEETGLILPLGHWVLETACSQLATWATRPEMAHLTLAVNVSAHQFHQHDFVDQVLKVLTNTGANPHRLKLELTESLLVENVEEIIEKMFALKAKGVGFSLDDFGTGYSSLSYLKRLPLDQLKIDQSFVRDVLIDPNDAAIAKTIIALAQSLGLSVIAEGVETAAQRDFLASSGCHIYQGYFFSRPIPLDGFERLFQGCFIPA